MKCGVVVFPGSNCDHDFYHILKHIYKLDTEWIWHKETQLGQFDLVVLPGGFSYGDYLRAGAIAKFSPIMKAVVNFANSGGRVIGICNGFQILLESGLLPGALMHNASQKFICKFVNLRVENSKSIYTNHCEKNSVLKIPVAHGEGSYFTDSDTLKRLNDNDQILFRYCGENGEIDSENNPNGSAENIAGIINEKGNVMGMMPHPERAADPAWEHLDGQRIFQSMVNSL
ncbi:MAG: phosphoribosylformylglycinamidine synthase subunit PurQ [Nitrospinales bacterium]